ncbi:MAG: hypothetical protein ACLQPD_06565 [Desulfomonilaceae bacterium]
MTNDKEEREETTEPSSDESSIQASEESTKPATDDFDIESYRLTQDYASLIEVKKVITTVPVKKPESQWFVQVHAEWHLETAVLEDKEDRAIYLVVPSLWAELAHETTRTVLFAAINTQKVVFLWPLKLPREEGRTNHWNESAREAVRLAKKGWVRVRSNMTLGAYECMIAGGKLPDPEWPQDIGFNELVRIAFRDRIISEWQHPVLRRLRGE